MLLLLSAILIFLSSMGMGWDRWWHIAIGRETFWIPPHLLIILPVAVSAVLMLIWVTRRGADETHAKIFGWGFILLSTLFFISIAFDELWHRAYGKEQINSLLILWSPPHILNSAILTIRAFIFVGLLHHLKIFSWFRILPYAAMLAHADLILKAFSPFDVYKVGGAVAIAVPVAFFIAVILGAKRLREDDSAFLITAAYLVAVQLGTSTTYANWVPLPQNVVEYPQWLRAFSYVGGAFVFDIFWRSHYSRLYVSSLAGFAVGLLGVVSSFIIPPTIVQPFTMFGAFLVIVGASVGGGFGWLFCRLPFQKWLVFAARKVKVFLLLTPAFMLLLLLLPNFFQKNQGWVSVEELRLPARRAEFASALLDNHIYIIGGYDEAAMPSRTVFVLSPDRKKWRETSPLPVALHHPAAAAVGNALYVAGGFSSSVTAVTQKPENALFRYNPASEIWETLPPMRAARGALTIVAFGETLYAFGGHDAAWKNIQISEKFDTKKGVWENISPLPQGVNHHVTIATDNLVIVLGGREYDLSPSARSRIRNSSKVFIYNPATNLWSEGPSLPVGRSGFAASMIGSEFVYIAGGEAHNTVIKDAILFHLKNGVYYSAPAPTYARHGFSIINDGVHLWAIGGSVNPRISASDVVETADTEKIKERAADLNP